MESAQLIKPHVSVRVIKSIVLYIERAHPRVDVRGLCDEARIPYEFLLDENNWISITSLSRFLNGCFREVEDSQFSWKAGFFGFSRETLGPVFVAFLKYRFTLRRLYLEVPKFVSILNKISKFVVMECSRNSIVYRVSFENTDFDDEEKGALRASYVSFLQSTCGYLAAIPTIYGQNQASVVATEVDSYVAYISCNFEEKPHFGRGILFLLLSLMAFVLIGRSASLEGMLLVIILGLIAGLATFYVKLRKIAADLHNAHDNLRAIDARASHLHSVLDRLEKNIAQTELMNRALSKHLRIAHDIRSPVAALEVAAGEVDSSQSEVAKLIREASARVKEIADSALRSGMYNAKASLMDLGSLIHEHKLRHKDRVDISLNAPGLSQTLPIPGDYVEFARALSNLISNAAEAIRGTGAVRVEMRSDGADLVIFVSDNGNGMSEELRLRLLSEKGPLTFGKADGHGLGLSQVKAYLNSVGGSLEIESHLQVGTTICLRLPLGQ